MSVTPLLSGTGSQPDASGGDAYARAGVDLDSRNALVEGIKRISARTSRPEVLGGVGGFGALYRLAGYREPVLASSTDGVGTKLRIAQIMDRYDTVGEDLVNHCVNDILTTGARPLFFLDYVGASDLTAERKLALIEGMQRACSAHDCVLIGGETADMPDVYAPGDFDLVGFIVGAVEREDVIDGLRVVEGDLLFALPSNGLHTNGYSLARRVFGVGTGGDPGADRATLAQILPPLELPLGDALLATHTSYYHALAPVMPHLHAIAHITGGGLIDNVPRVLPADLAAEFDSSSWPVPPIFQLIQRHGEISVADMYHTFNMGIGIVVAVAQGDANAVARELPGAMRVGRVVRQAGDRRVVIR